MITKQNFLSVSKFSLLCLIGLSLVGCVESRNTKSNSVSNYQRAQNQRAAEGRRINASIDNAIRSYRRVANSVSLGQSKQVVLNILQPTQSGLGKWGKSSEALFSDGKRIEIFYMRSSRIPDGNTTDDEFTPYLFVDDELAGIGWRALGGAKTHGDTNAVAKANAQNRDATNAMLLQMLNNNQQQQRQLQQQRFDQQQQKAQHRQQQILNANKPPPNRKVECRTVYYGNASRTECN
jgi:hypothetical protein